MKKIILLFVGLMFTSATFFAQSRETGTIEFIPYIGYASSNLEGDFQKILMQEVPLILVLLATTTLVTDGVFVRVWLIIVWELLI